MIGAINNNMVNSSYGMNQTRFGMGNDGSSTGECCGDKCNMQSAEQANQQQALQQIVEGIANLVQAMGMNNNPNQSVL